MRDFHLQVAPLSWENLIVSFGCSSAHERTAANLVNMIANLLTFPVDPTSNSRNYVSGLCGRRKDLMEGGGGCMGNDSMFF